MNKTYCYAKRSNIAHMKRIKQSQRLCIELFIKILTHLNAARLLQANHQQHQLESVCTQIHRTNFK